MSPKNFVACVINVTIGAISLLFTVFIAIDFMLFLSNPNYTKIKQLSKYADKNEMIAISWSLFTNILLLSGFVMQHSLMALTSIKNLFSQLNLHIVQRSIYVLSSSLILWVLMNNWQTIPSNNLWNFNVSGRSWWFFFISHFLSWATIYTGCICLDFTELIGLKQIYYSIQKLPEPNSYKSPELQRLSSHIRHPSFTAFLIIFWVTPIMSLDRLLLALVWSVYMYLAWNPNQEDYFYQKVQIYKKKQELYKVI